MKIDIHQYDVVVTFRNGKQMTGRCTGNPIVGDPRDRHGIFDHQFLFLDTCVLKAAECEYDTGYRAMIRTEDISMIQVKKVVE